MFGGGGGMGRRGGRRRGEDTMHPCHVTLEEFYNGTTRKLKLSRTVLCPKCKG